MKSKIILLSSIASLLFGTTSGTIYHSQLISVPIVNNKAIGNNSGANSNIINNIKATNWLFNNEYGLLDNSSSEVDNDWITGQSLSEHKFYSYDTAALANYSFKNARKAFIVDSNGNLVANPEVTIPETDKFDIANTRQEMITHRHVTIFKDEYNPYSKSEYHTAYFTGDDSGWKYLQLGGYAPSIDISQQNGGNIVVHSTNLNEPLAFYYIAQAMRQTVGGLSFEVAKNLTHYFIDHSSINDKASVKTLADDLIPLIANNSTIYQYIRTSWVQLDYKNFSFNYILDSNNNLVALYYQQWDTSNINVSVNFNYENWFNGTSSSNSFNYDKNPYVKINTTSPVILSWKKYARDWATFVTIFPQLTFDEDSVMVMTTNDYFYREIRGKDISINATEISINKGANTSSFAYQYYRQDNFFEARILSCIWLWAWHDDDNIYFNLGGYETCGQVPWGLHYLMKLNNCILHSCMT